MYINEAFRNEIKCIPNDFNIFSIKNNPSANVPDIILSMFQHIYS